MTGAIGSIGDAMSLTVIALLPVTIFVCIRYVPETRGTDLSHLDELAMAEAAT